jgi:CysZ protein
MIKDALGALAQVFSPPLRKVVLRSVGLAILLLIALGALLQWLLRLIPLSYPFDLAAAIAVGLITVFAAIFLMAPVSSLIAALFVDEVADEVERTQFPAEPRGQALSMPRSLAVSAKFFGVVLAVNIVALLLWFVPIVNLVVFFVANAYLLSREYFEMAAMRYRTPEEARRLRKSHALLVFVSGLPIALLVAIPVVNLITPVFATAYMVRRHKRLSKGPAMA